MKILEEVEINPTETYKEGNLDPEKTALSILNQSKILDEKTKISLQKLFEVYKRTHYSFWEIRQKLLTLEYMISSWKYLNYPGILKHVKNCQDVGD